MDKPRLFIGSASETLGIVEALESELRDVATIQRWDLDVFRPGHFILDELSRAGTKVDFAVFVLGREDHTDSRGNTTPSPRDNVVFEAGLFTATLSRERTFYVVDKTGTKIPSDWAGLGYLTFDDSEERPRDKVYDAAREIRKQIASLKPMETTIPLAPIVGHWWQIVISTEKGAVLSLMEIKATESALPVLHGTAWATDGTLIARYKSQSVRYDEEKRRLYYSWEGEHPREELIPLYFGVGEVTFHPSPDNTMTRGEGWFSTSRRSDVRDALIKSAVYNRADLDDVTTILGTDHDKRVTLIKAKLSERTQLDS